MRNSEKQESIQSPLSHDSRGPPKGKYIPIVEKLGELANRSKIKSA